MACSGASSQSFHLWDRQTARVAPRYLLDEILDDVGAGHNVVSTVFIECGAMFKKRLTSGCSAAEKAKLLHDTAARVYRLEGPA